MKARVAPRLAWSAFGLTLLLAALSAVFVVLNRFSPSQGEFEEVGLTNLVFVFVFLGYSAIGAIIASRRPENPIGWIFSFVALALGVSFVTNGYAVHAVFVQPGGLPAAAAFAWIATWIWVPGFGIGYLFLPLLFPDGHLPSPRWRPVAWLALGGLSALTVSLALSPGRLQSFPLDNPLGVEPAGTVLGVLRAAAFPLVPALTIVAAISLILRYRRAGGEERRQIQWFAYAVALLTATVVLGLSLNALGIEAPWIGRFLAPAAFVGIPAAVGVAILRYRLYEIERIISRTVAYGLLTGVLAAVYLALVILLQQVFRPLTGSGDLAIAGSTLAVAAVFRPARRRIQSFVDRRFYRRKYDAARTLEAFSARLREEIDLDTLRYELTEVVRETMQPAHASLWLRGQAARAR